MSELFVDAWHEDADDDRHWTENTRDKPWKSIRCLHQLNVPPGTVITFLGGTYANLPDFSVSPNARKIQNTMSGKPGNRIIVRGDPDPLCQTTFTGYELCATQALVSFHGSHIQIQDIDFDGRYEMTPGCFAYQPRLLTLGQNPGRGFAVDVQLSNLNFRNNVGIDDLLWDERKDQGDDSQGRGDLVYASAIKGLGILGGSFRGVHNPHAGLPKDTFHEDGLTVGNGTTMWISDVTFGDHSHCAIKLGDAGGVIENCIFMNRLHHGIGGMSGSVPLTVRNNRFWSTSIWDSETRHSGSPVKWMSRSNMWVYDNIMSGGKIAFGLLGTTDEDPCENNFIFNNWFDGTVSLGRFGMGSTDTILLAANKYIKCLEIWGDVTYPEFLDYLSTNQDAITVANNVIARMRYRDTAHIGAHHEHPEWIDISPVAANEWPGASTDNHGMPWPGMPA